MTTATQTQSSGGSGRTQEYRSVAVGTPLGKDVLLFYRMNSVEELGRLFRFELDLLSEKHDLKFEDVLGQKMTVRLDLGVGKKRYFNGHVSSFTQSGTVGPLFCYHAVLRPWFWFLSLTSTCRIFQQKKIPDIITEVFAANGFTDYEKALSGSYKTWEYCVQYRETDFNFVSRLMEQQGIYYYFKHENDKHTMVLSDSVSSHSKFSGYEKVPFFPYTEGQQRERDHINVWSIHGEVQSGACALNDFDFKRPKANLNVRSAVKRSYVMSELEIYDYPGEYVQTDEGEGYARYRVEELHSEHELLHGQGDARGLGAGNLFELTGHTRTDQNREYLIVSSSINMSSEEYGTSSTGGSSGFFFNCGITAIPSQQAFRPARTTPKPLVQGLQTAIVVGPSGNEIYTDQYGRVKVHFHWDRYNKYDENASCWIRVAQLWAGAKWGAIHIPRIGQEVIVDFLEGDPDRPIITGRVYNADNMPPYDLPANMTQSGIKTRSTKGGSPTNINELRFEDKKGEECIFIQAEKDKEIRVKNDRVEFVGNESHFIIKKDQLEQVKGDKHLTVKGDHNEKVEGTISITASQDMQVKVSGGKYGLETSSEIHLKSQKLILQADNITIKAGSSFITLGSSGVDIKGTMVNINSGGSPGSGSGCSPESPKLPREPGTSKATQKEVLPSPPKSPSPQAHSFKSAAVTGSPLVEC